MGAFSSRRIKWTLPAVLLGIALALGITLRAWLLPADSAPPPASGPGAVTVETALVRTDTASVEAQAVGSLRANESVIIRPEIDGRIARIEFAEGEAIAQGARLVVLDAEELKALLEQSRAEAELARLNFERSKQLLPKKVITQQDYDQAASRLAEAEARLALARARLAKTVLRAPFDGILGLRRVSPGDYVEAGQDIVNLESIDPVKLDFQLPERYAGDVRERQRVRVTVDAFPEQTFIGEVYAVSPSLEAATRTLMLRARIPNPRERLRPGMFARATIVFGERANALWVPEQAIVPRGREQFVFRVLDGRAALTKVETGQRRVGEVEITTGLAASDTVVTAGHAKLSDGAPVSVAARAGESKASAPDSRRPL